MKSTLRILAFVSAAIMQLAICAQNTTMNITIDGKTLTANLIDNSSTRSLIERLQQGEVTYTANDYGGFEKVGDLGFSLPQNNTYITTSPGDIILYQGRNLCLYYAQNSWDFTRIGKIDFTTESELRDFLKAGKGQITVTLSLPGNYSAPSLNDPDSQEGDAYHVDGARADASAKGIVIKNGKKTLNR